MDFLRGVRIKTLSCEDCGGYITAPIVLTVRVRLKDKHTPIKKYLGVRKLFGSDIKHFILEEARTQELDLLECEDCEKQI